VQVVDKSSRQIAQEPAQSAACPAGNSVLSVIGSLQFGRWDVAAVLIEAAVVEPGDPFGGGQLDLLEVRQGLRGLINSVLYRPLIVSARALS
jgi:hypothetical protein